MTTDDELTRVLEATRFEAPPLDSVWQPRQAPARSSRRSWLVALAAAALLLVSAGVVLATSGVLSDFLSGFGGRDCQPDQCGPTYRVVARLEDMVDEPVIALNVSVTGDLSSDEIRAVAEGFQQRHGDARVIVYVFDAPSADRHFGFGLIPSTNAEQAPPPLDRTGWIATFDFASNGAVREDWASPR